MKVSASHPEPGKRVGALQEPVSRRERLHEQVPEPRVAQGPLEELVDPPAFPIPPLPRYKQRAADEWQGMLVDLSTQPRCLDGAYCGLARACIDEVCTACEKDSDCGPGEGCVLDHCLLASRIMCRSTNDCPDRSTCILSGYSPDPRSNGGMDAVCVSPDEGKGKDSVVQEFSAADFRPSKRQGPEVFSSELERARAARARASAAE